MQIADIAEAAISEAEAEAAVWLLRLLESVRRRNISVGNGVENQEVYGIKVRVNKKQMMRGRAWRIGGLTSPS